MTHHAHSKPSEPFYKQFIPKIVTTFEEGYSWNFFKNDALAGLTVAIVAIPLAMALGIASGTTPDKGLITAVIAGFLISALGGSRVQIGGPTGAFVVVVYNVIAQHGYDGLVIATLMAGFMLMLAGFLKVGSWIKYIPHPVITGFTAGIAVIIFSSQIKDLFGLQIEKVPGDFIEKWGAFWEVRDTFNPVTIALSAGSLFLIIALRKYAPSIPAFLAAVVVASLVTLGFHLDVTTIGSAFGGIPQTLPVPEWPEGLTLTKMKEVLPSALTIAFLAGVESLLSAVVADGMINRRHKSNCELVGQGVANVASAFFGGMPATGAIARTVTNIRSGAKSPVSGMLHAVFILLAMMLFAPLASYIPLAALAAVLVIVAWNMSEQDKIRHLMHAPLSERLVLFATFFLTVAVDLTVAIEVGVVASALFFMRDMAEHNEFIKQEESGEGGGQETLPEGVVSYRLWGPLFFGNATALIDVFENLSPVPRVFILRMRFVPLIDSSGQSALQTFLSRCEKKGICVIISHLKHQPHKILKRMGVLDKHGVLVAANFTEALALAQQQK